MKKLKIISIVFVLLLMISIASYAAIDETLRFEVQYDGKIKVNEEKTSVTVLAGTGTPLHNHVRIKVDVEGPAIPKLLATDSTGKQYDIAQIGYWGPDTGFPIQGDFYNETMVKSTYPKAGTYVITLSVIDVDSDNAVLAQKAFTFEVEDEPQPESQTNETVNEKTNETLPKTGTSLIEYIVYGGILIFAIYLVYRLRQRAK